MTLSKSYITQVIYYWASAYFIKHYTGVAINIAPDVMLGRGSGKYLIIQKRHAVFLLLDCVSDQWIDSECKIFLFSSKHISVAKPE